MKRFLFLSKILAGCAFFSHYHGQNNLSFLRSTNLIAIKKMVSYKKLPIFRLKFSDIQKKSAQSSAKAIAVVRVNRAPETFFETYKQGLKLFSAWLAVLFSYSLVLLSIPLVFTLFF